MRFEFPLQHAKNIADHKASLLMGLNAEMFLPTLVLAPGCAQAVPHSCMEPVNAAPAMEFNRLQHKAKHHVCGYPPRALSAYKYAVH